jgi:hypothetical protein
VRSRRSSLAELRDMLYVMLIISSCSVLLVREMLCTARR